MSTSPIPLINRNSLIPKVLLHRHAKGMESLGHAQCSVIYHTFHCQKFGLCYCTVNFIARNGAFFTRMLSTTGRNAFYCAH